MTEIKGVPFYKTELFNELLLHFFVLVDDNTDPELLECIPQKSQKKMTPNSKLCQAGGFMLKIFLEPMTERANCKGVVLEILQETIIWNRDYTHTKNLCMSFENAFSDEFQISYKSSASYDTYFAIPQYFYDQDEYERFNIGHTDHNLLFNLSMLNKDTIEALISKLAFIIFSLKSTVPKELILVIFENIPNFNSLRSHLILK